MTELLDILAQPAFWVAVLRIATPLIFGTLGVLLCEAMPDDVRQLLVEINRVLRDVRGGKPRVEALRAMASAEHRADQIKRDRD
jgi:hypothetical protein